MAGYFVLDYKGGAPGVPPFVEGQIDAFVDDEWDDDDPAVVGVYRDSKPLELRTKHKRLDFDYAKVHSLFLCSDAFCERLDGMACSLERRPLRVWEGKAEVTRKKFFVALVNDRLFAMDPVRSVYRVNRDPASGAIRPHWADPAQRQYRYVYELVIDPAAARGKDLFWSYEAVRNIVSERLAKRLDGLSGVSVTPVEQYSWPIVGDKIVDLG